LLALLSNTHVVASRSYFNPGALLSSSFVIWGDDGARAIGMMMRPLRRRRLTAISYGVIDNRSENLQH
jgi:hypothetical protein